MDATTYHRHTSYSRHGMTPHQLDWGNVPLQHKVYDGLDTVALKPSSPGPAVSLADVFEGKTVHADPGPALHLSTLSSILTLANGVTETRRYGSQTMHFRSSPSAGALYPNEIYVAAAAVAGLDPGLYNFQAADASLVKLNSDSALKMIGGALAGHGGAPPAASLPVTAVFFRSAWKYRARAFRYVLLDAGHLIENLVLAIRAMGYHPTVHYDFDDEAMAGCLGVDGEREVCLAVINLYDKAGKGNDLPEGWASIGAQGDRHDLRHLVGASRVAAVETRYNAILEAYRAGGTMSPERVADKVPDRMFENTPRTWFPVRDPGLLREEQGYLKSVLRRRSRRNFVPQPLTTARAMALLCSLCPPGGPAGDDGNVHAGCMSTGFIATHIEAFDPGIYLLDTLEKRYGLNPGGRHSAGRPGEETARFCLDQSWLKNGALHFLFSANLNRIDRQQGPRGYRYAMLNAGRAGQRIYLAATALGLGACGIGAIYDDEAAGMLGLNDESALLYLVGVGMTK